MRIVSFWDISLLDIIIIIIFMWDDNVLCNINNLDVFPTCWVFLLYGCVGDSSGSFQVVYSTHAS